MSNTPTKWQIAGVLSLMALGVILIIGGVIFAVQEIQQWDPNDPMRGGGFIISLICWVVGGFVFYFLYEGGKEATKD